MTGDTSTRVPWRAIAAAIAVGTLMRVRFVWTGLLADEGGALSAAREWAAGHSLYRTVWIDRPQGMVLLYRLWDALPGTGPSSVRVLAIVLGATGVTGAAVVAWAFGGRRAAVVTAWMAALVTASPMLEGFSANGELLAAGFSLPAMALVALVVSRRITVGWMTAAGVLTGVALVVKQSSFDVGVAVFWWVVVTLAAVPAERRRAMAAGAYYVLGALVAPAGAVLHGISLGWHRYWFAVVGFRSHSRSALAAPEWDRLGLSLLFAAPILAPLAIVAVRGARGLRRRTIDQVPGLTLLGVWCLAALGSFASGGSFWRHYFLILAYPLAVAAGLAATRLDGPVRRLVAPTALLCVGSALPMVAVPRLILGDVTERNRAVADWYHRLPAAERGSVYAYCADAALYSELGITPGFPYLWEDHVRLVPGAEAQLADYLGGDAAPRYVVLVQPLDRCDSTGAVTATLNSRYTASADVDGLRILALTEHG